MNIIEHFAQRKCQVSTQNNGTPNKYKLKDLERIDKGAYRIKLKRVTSDEEIISSDMREKLFEHADTEQKQYLTKIIDEVNGEDNDSHQNGENGNHTD